jgi:acyl dehydratase
MEFETLPSLVGGYARALFQRRPPFRVGGEIRRIEAALPAIVPDPAKLAKYREVCGFPGGPDLPLTYPAVLASPLHLKILTSPAFPLKAIGIVHVKNLIVQRRPLPASATLAYRTWVEGHRERHNGIEFDLRTEVSEGGSVGWESTMTIFSRQPGRKDVPRAEPEGPEWPATSRLEETWRLADDLGRRYAAASGDYNVNHLYPWTAKLMAGFPRHIAHGMWSVAHAVARMGDAAPASGVRVWCEFKRPMFLPSEVEFRFGDEDGGLRFAARVAGGGKTCLVGTVRREA